jgi:hypothetical protein
MYNIRKRLMERVNMFSTVFFRGGLWWPVTEITSLPMALKLRLEES